MRKLLTIFPLTLLLVLLFYSTAFADINKPKSTFVAPSETKEYDTDIGTKNGVVFKKISFNNISLGGNSFLYNLQDKYAPLNKTGYTVIHENDVDSWIAFYGKSDNPLFIEKVKSKLTAYFVQTAPTTYEFFYNHAEVAAMAGGQSGEHFSEEGVYGEIIKNVKRYNEGTWLNSSVLELPSEIYEGKEIPITTKTTDGSYYVHVNGAQLWQLWSVYVHLMGSDGKVAKAYTVVENALIYPGASRFSSHTFDFTFPKAGKYQVHFVYEDVSNHSDYRTGTKNYSLMKEVEVKGALPDLSIDQITLNHETGVVSATIHNGTIEANGNGNLPIRWAYRIKNSSTDARTPTSGENSDALTTINLPFKANEKKTVNIANVGNVKNLPPNTQLTVFACVNPQNASVINEMDYTNNCLSETFVVGESVSSCGITKSGSTRSYSVLRCSGSGDSYSCWCSSRSVTLYHSVNVTYEDAGISSPIWNKDVESQRWSKTNNVPLAKNDQRQTLFDETLRKLTGDNSLYATIRSGRGVKPTGTIKVTGVIEGWSPSDVDTRIENFKNGIVSTLEVEGIDVKNHKGETKVKGKTISTPQTTSSIVFDRILGDSSCSTQRHVRKTFTITIPIEVEEATGKIDTTNANIPKEKMFFTHRNTMDGKYDLRFNTNLNFNQIDTALNSSTNRCSSSDMNFGVFGTMYEDIKVVDGDGSGFWDN